MADSEALAFRLNEVFPSKDGDVRPVLDVGRDQIQRFIRTNEKDFARIVNMSLADVDLFVFLYRSRTDRMRDVPQSMQASRAWLVGEWLSLLTYGNNWLYEGAWKNLVAQELRLNEEQKGKL